MLAPTLSARTCDVDATTEARQRKDIQKQFVLIAQAFFSREPTLSRSKASDLGDELAGVGADEERLPDLGDLLERDLADRLVLAGRLELTGLERGGEAGLRLGNLLGDCGRRR